MISPASDSLVTSETGHENKALLDVVVNVPDDTEETLISASGSGRFDKKSDVETDNDNMIGAKECGGRQRNVCIWIAKQIFGRIIREMVTDVWNFLCSELITMDDA